MPLYIDMASNQSLLAITRSPAPRDYRRCHSESKRGPMLQTLIDALFGCRHQRTTFPITPRRQIGTPKRQTYVVCLDCGREIAYSWDTMTLGAELKPEPEPRMVPPRIEQEIL